MRYLETKWSVLESKKIALEPNSYGRYITQSLKAQAVKLKSFMTQMKQLQFQ